MDLNEFLPTYLTTRTQYRTMRRQFLVSIALCATAWSLGWVQAARAAEAVNSSVPYYRTKGFSQRVALDFREVAIVSPNGNAVVYLEGGTHFAAERKVLHIARLDAGNDWRSHPLAMGALWQFSDADRSVPAYRWASNSAGVWTATRENIGPDGINRSGLQPAFIALEDNRIQLFEPPRHAAGPLDGLLWAGGDGLALARFGARGASYQPQRHDKNPTFAIVDARRGTVLDTLPFDVFRAISKEHYIANLDNAAATRLQNGKVRAVLLALNQWAVWTQGERPRILLSPYSDPKERHNKIAISRDGSRLLVARQHCDGGYEDVSEPDALRRRPTTPPCKPVESVIAALHDLETGRQLWDVRATVHRKTQYPNPAISDDGRYALIGLPYKGSDSQIALISMNDGKTVQTFRPPGYALNSMGFLGGGRGVWIHGDGATDLYEHSAQAQ
ncbi:hypothetical protein [Bradyrhizobium archetypum]|uniref:WD40 repeat domain-containing protein n=1 Tax=Bradyrhizobium archetypum TaxID=2721160 RepID=A0A7Y4H709_9BRAD|nr:hypothetical protein [Bradyrhizobium archetypum]NOJ48831.1 hypothetical protein [Bradyrhizobium archetypum]